MSQSHSQLRNHVIFNWNFSQPWVFKFVMHSKVYVLTGRWAFTFLSNIIYGKNFHHAKKNSSSTVCIILHIMTTTTKLWRFISRVSCVHKFNFQSSFCLLHTSLHTAHYYHTQTCWNVTYYHDCIALWYHFNHTLYCICNVMRSLFACQRQTFLWKKKFYLVIIWMQEK